MNLIPATNGLFPQQNKAIEFLNEFQHSKSIQFALLSGYAGTGKTYILKYFLDNHFKRSVVVTAPTHKAVRVVENHLNRKSKTLQSLLGLRLNTDLASFDISSPSFTQAGIEYIKDYHLIIVDESSMINKGLYEFLIERAKLYGTKILFVGDFCQLPPIGETISQAYNIEYKFELTELVRQKATNPLVIILDIIRNDIITKSNDFFDYIKKNRQNTKDGEGYVLLNESSFKENIIKYYKHTNFYNNVDFIRCLSWTNDSVDYWNKHIRDSILDNPIELLTEHDLLTAYSTIVEDGINVPIIVNSEDYIVSQIREYEDDTKILNYAVNLQLINGGLETKTLKIVNPKDKKGFTNYYNTLSALHNRAINSNHTNRRMNWNNYYKFKDSHLSMISFRLRKDFNNNALVKKDIDYGYALTVHKSQGSTFDNVCVDLEDIMFPNGRNNSDKILRDKLIYVALSRAKKLALLKL